MKHVVCYSGGHSSGLVAIEVARRYGKENTVLLNHDISNWTEDSDIKRFKREVADYIGIPITYANYGDLKTEQLPDQFDVCVEAGSFINPYDRNALCTNRLKTTPFTRYLGANFPEKDCVVYYGFDANESHRIERRRWILLNMGFESDYPLALWEESGINRYNEYVMWQVIMVHNRVNGTKFKRKGWRVFLEYYGEKEEYGLYKGDLRERTIHHVSEIGIRPPNSYSKYKHANCQGCLKGGKQHWYVTYCERKDVFEKGKATEEKIGYSIIKGHFLKDLEVDFEKMKAGGVRASEHIPSKIFWKQASRFIEKDEVEKPCECFT